MSRTIRSLPYSGIRNPRGRVAAIRRGDRAIPPDPYDDLFFHNDVMNPYRVLQKLEMQGVSDKRIESVLRKKFGLPWWRAKEMVRGR